MITLKIICLICSVALLQAANDREYCGFSWISDTFGGTSTSINAVTANLHRNDLLMKDAAGALKLSYGYRNGEFERSSVSIDQSSFCTGGNIVVADINADHRDDLLCHKPEGTFSVRFYSSGTYLPESDIAIGYNCPFTNTLKIGNFDGKAGDDIMCLNRAGANAGPTSSMFFFFSCPMVKHKHAYYTAPTKPPPHQHVPFLPPRPAYPMPKHAAYQASKHFHGPKIQHPMHPHGAYPAPKSPHYPAPHPNQPYMNPHVRYPVPAPQPQQPNFNHHVHYPAPAPQPEHPVPAPKPEDLSLNHKFHYPPSHPQPENPSVIHHLHYPATHHVVNPQPEPIMMHPHPQMMNPGHIHLHHGPGPLSRMRQSRYRRDYYGGPYAYTANHYKDGGCGAGMIYTFPTNSLGSCDLTVTAGVPISEIIVGDFNNDHIDDIACNTLASGALNYYLSNGGSTGNVFPATGTLDPDVVCVGAVPPVTTNAKLIAADIDGDGDDDLICVAAVTEGATGTPKADVYFSDGTTFAAVATPGAGTCHSFCLGPAVGTPVSYTVGDYNEDGFEDFLCYYDVAGVTHTDIVYSSVKQ